jgi:hypothetical protein
MPLEARAGQELLDVYQASIVEVQFVKRKIDVGLVNGIGVEIDGDPNDVVTTGSGLPVEKNMVVVGGVKPEI